MLDAQPDRDGSAAFMFDLTIVMELVHGTDLGVLLKRNGRRGLSIGDAVEYVRHGCEALSYVHSQQILKLRRPDRCWRR